MLVDNGSTLACIMILMTLSVLHTEKSLDKIYNYVTTSPAFLIIELCDATK